jgi:hypothetical protein
MHKPYHGTDQIHIGNELGMSIDRTGNTIIPTSSCPLMLKHVLHVPSTHKNLISVHHFTLDNDTFIEFHPYFFLIKEQKMRRVLLCGQCRGGLYPLPPSTSKFRKLMFSAIKIPVDRWHNCLDHPSRDIVCHIISKNNLPYAYFSLNESVCDACACAKGHQWSFPLSSSSSSAPLWIVYSNVWGPAVDSFGHKKYYVSFIDDFSKFMWIYLLRHKSEVSKYFLEFHKLVEHLLDKKIIAV